MQRDTSHKSPGVVVVLNGGKNGYNYRIFGLSCPSKEYGIIVNFGKIASIEKSIPNEGLTNYERQCKSEKQPLIIYGVFTGSLTSSQPEGCTRGIPKVINRKL